MKKIKEYFLDRLGFSGILIAIVRDLGGEAVGIALTELDGTLVDF